MTKRLIYILAYAEIIAAFYEAFLHQYAEAGQFFALSFIMFEVANNK